MPTDHFGVRVLGVDPTEQRACFRVFFVGDNDLDPGAEVLPDDAGFFLRVLWESASGVHSHHGPLADLIGADLVHDDAWVAAHTPLFVAEYARLTTHRHPLDEDSFVDAAISIPARDCWQDEDELPGAITRYASPTRAGLLPSAAARTGAPPWNPRRGPSMPRRRMPKPATPNGPTARADGRTRRPCCWATCASGAADLAAEAYERAFAVAPDLESEARALLFELDLLAARGGDSMDAVFRYRHALECTGERIRGRDTLGIADLVRDMGHPEMANGPYGAAELLHARAGLRIGSLLADLGAEEEFARNALASAEMHGDPGMVQEARRLGGAETPGERGYRLYGVGTEEQARQALLDAYGSAAVADFGLTLYDQEFARTEGLYGPRFARAGECHAALTEPAELSAAGS
ncbi:hypothetical protein ITI46_05140 [Streptomyces oryzae]|uniref:Tetratricopeptide repeat protein n=1 Tax=Streptomyces oryzae TaxID=1434886 RepID=A0ABS3X6S8_9ACTN|nr:hypothetical protein [Streptomyces oryzae]MBO8191082.1 hypothetical protein [Streptomyces oryzae]